MKSGITGVVVQIGTPGPSHPNDPPRYYKGPLEVMRSSDGQLAGTTTSDENGKFTVALAPGEYFITQTNPHLSRIHSEPIIVEKGKFTSVKIYADNGMR
ncbi:MAG TPA: SpaA isopeptide-forming pilin-related protein [Candidatus Dormibacteraeota bacterium]|nr:SpaA isopeptide-forming pilin-related protein [Candidatus Dormibacteraeota bacterium]